MGADPPMGTSLDVMLKPSPSGPARRAGGGSAAGQRPASDPAKVIWIRLIRLPGSDEDSPAVLSHYTPLLDPKAFLESFIALLLMTDM